MARVMRDDGKTRRPSLALGCIDMRSCTDHRHAHTGLAARLRSASDDGNRRNGNRRDRQQNGTALDPMHPTHSPAPHGSSFRLCVGFTTLTSPRSIAPARALALVRSGERTRATWGIALSARAGPPAGRGKPMRFASINKVARARGWGPFSDRRGWQFETSRACRYLCSWRSHRSFKKRRGVQVTKAVFADIWQKRLTPERLAAWLLDLARAGQRRRSLSGGIGHLAGTETTESDARVK